VLFQNNDKILQIIPVKVNLNWTNTCKLLPNKPISAAVVNGRAVLLHNVVTFKLDEES
jgi:hypothetical protein